MGSLGGIEQAVTAASTPPTGFRRSLPVEELGQHSPALVGAYAGDHLGPVVEPTIAYDVPERPDGTGLVVVRAEH
jgi:hypothetical protein